MLTHPPARDVIHTLVDWAAARASVRALLLTSTRALPDAHLDVLSDYDVILVVQAVEPWVADRSWLNDFGEVLVAYWDPLQPDPDFGMNQCANVVQYADGLKLDFSLWPMALLQKIVALPELPAELDAGYQVLLDKDQLTAALRPPTFKAYLPKPPSLATYQVLINDFLSDAPYVAKCLWRDELLPAKWCLDFDMKHLYLRQMLEWRMGIEQDWSVPAGSLGKGLKRHLPADLWTQVEETYAGASRVENGEALERTLALFRQVALEVGRYFGYPYPEAMHQRVTAYVDKIKQLQR
jgi:aminoglycoside 6-adenylyltransferase